MSTQRCMVEECPNKSVGSAIYSWKPPGFARRMKGESELCGEHMHQWGGAEVPDPEPPEEPESATSLKSAVEAGLIDEADAHEAIREYFGEPEEHSSQPFDRSR